jgi:chromosome segregation ATPase
MEVENQNLTNRVTKLEDRTNVMDIKVSVFESIVNQFSITNEKLGCSIDRLEESLNKINLSMVSMQNEIVNNSAATKKLETKFDTLDDSTKFNFIDFLKTSVIPLLVGAGALYLILEIVGKVR